MDDKETIDDFKRITTEMRDSDALLREDLHRGKLNTKIIYAIDSVEAYVYLFPDGTRQNDVYYDNSPNVLLNAVVNEALLDLVFSKFSEQITILPPHVSEIRHLIANCEQDRLRLQTLIKESQNVKFSSNEKKLKVLQSEFSNLIAGKGSKERLSDALYDSAPLVLPYVMALKNTHSVVENKIEKIFSRDKVNRFFKLFPQAAELEVDEEIFNYCIDLFNKLRRGRSAANATDAYALALMHKINHGISDNKYQIRLITRAPIMQTVAEKLYREHLKGFSNSIPIRHPMTFLPFLYAHISNKPESAILSERKAVFNAIEDLSSPESGKSLVQIVKHRIAVSEINEFLTSNTKLNKILLFDSLFKNQNKGNTNLPTTKAIDLSQFIKQLTEQSGAQILIESLAEQLISDIHKSVLGASVFDKLYHKKITTRSDEKITHLTNNMSSELKNEPSKESSNQVIATKIRRPIWITSINKISLLTLEFYSPQTKKNLTKLYGHHIKFDVVAESLMEISNETYESSLAIAYLFALLRDWKWTYGFAQVALNLPSKDINIPRHEAYYLSAYSRRYNEPYKDQPKEDNVDMILSNLDDLKRSAELRGVAMKQSAPKFDPRLLSEIGICLAISNRDGLEIDYAFSSFDLPDDPILIWEKGLRLECLDIERLTLLNNICNFACTENTENLKVKYYAPFIKLAKQISFGKLEDFPAPIIDTIVKISADNTDLISRKYWEKLKALLEQSELTGMANHETVLNGV